MKKTGMMIVALVGLTLLLHGPEDSPAAGGEADTVRIYSVETGKFTVLPVIERSPAEWKKTLTAQQYRILREDGTEPPFRNAYWDNKREGIYRCAGCGTDLFSSDTKYRSGTGWPSFWQPVAPENIREVKDNSFFMRRIEVECARCGGHLGHVFNDGPPPTGLRYCINSESLTFTERSLDSSTMKKEG